MASDGAGFRAIRSGCLRLQHRVSRSRRVSDARVRATCTCLLRDPIVSARPLKGTCRPGVRQYAPGAAETSSRPFHLREEVTSHSLLCAFRQPRPGPFGSAPRCGGPAGRYRVVDVGRKITPRDAGANARRLLGVYQPAAKVAGTALSRTFSSQATASACTEPRPGPRPKTRSPDPIARSRTLAIGCGPPRD